MRVAVLVTLAIFSPVFTHAAIIITEIMFDPKGADANSGGEWIEVQNNDSASIDLTKWFFFEDKTHHGITTDGPIEIPSGGYAVISSDTTVFKKYFVNFSGLLFKASFSLNDSEDLAMKSGNKSTDPIIDSVTYSFEQGAKNDGNSLQKNSNGTWSPAIPTPGVANTSASSPPNDNSTPPDTSPGTDETTTVTPTSPSSDGSPPEYIPIPTLRIVTSGARTISSGADTAFTASVYDSRGNRRDDATVTWSFGDGMKRVGASVFNSYYSPGEYVVIVRATTSDGGDVFAQSVVTVKDANIKITSVSARGIALVNDSPRTLDLSLWRLSAGGQEFKIPTDTQILADRTILFPSQVIQLPITGSASLLYPNGEVATTYPVVDIQVQSNVTQPISSRQPSSGVTSYKKVQTVRLGEAPARQVEPIISTETNIQTHEQEIIAPSAVSATGTAEGAALASVASAEQPKTVSIFRSPWFLSLIGVITLASSALIFF